MADTELLIGPASYRRRFLGFRRLARIGTREGLTFFSVPHDPLRQPPKGPGYEAAIEPLLSGEGGYTFGSLWCKPKAFTVYNRFWSPFLEGREMFSGPESHNKKL